MKKLLLCLSSMLLLSATTANAVRWDNVPSGDSGVMLFVDRDNIQYVKPDTCYYPIMYQKEGSSAQVSYIKSNYTINHLGIIRNDDFDATNYNPMYIFKSFQVFMKPVIENSVVSYAHKYVSCLYTESEQALAYCNGRVYEAENGDKIASKLNTPKYMNKMKKSIRKNWILPTKGKNKTANVLVNVGENGALNGYHILQSTGEDLADRAIISAIELAAPFKNIQNINVKLKFRSELKDKFVE